MSKILLSGPEELITRDHCRAQALRTLLQEMNNSITNAVRIMVSEDLRYKSIVFFALNFSLRFDLVILLRSKTKPSEIQVYFFVFFVFFTFFRFFPLFVHFFSLNFRFASIFSLNFRLFYLRFRFRFLVFRSK